MSHTILFIEDNVSNVELVRILAESAGYTVLTAYEGEEGIALAQEQSPDLILCDYHLPYMNGVEIVKLLRADDRTRHIPIVMLTADIFAQEKAEALGIDGFLTKPIRRNMLLNGIERGLNLKVND